MSACDMVSEYDVDLEAIDLSVAEQVREVLATLSDGEREAIELAYFGANTYREVARLLDQPEGTIKSRIRTGLMRLRTQLLERGIDESWIAKLTPAELNELLPAHALDALDDDERMAVEAYVAQDAEAHDELASLRRSASFLAHTGGPPPAGVWDKLEATIRATPRPAGEVPPPRLLPVAHERAAACGPHGAGSGSRRPRWSSRLRCSRCG